MLRTLSLCRRTRAVARVPVRIAAPTLRTMAHAAAAAAARPWVVQGGSVLPLDLQSELEKVARPVPWSYLLTGRIGTGAARAADVPAHADPREWQGLTPADMRGMVVFGHVKVTGENLAPFTSLRVVSNVGVGVDHIALDACRARRVWVGHTPHVLTESVADHTFALLLSSARNIVQGDAWARATSAAGVPGGAPQSFFDKPEFAAWLGREASGSTLGVVGLGRIGLAVARRARAFGMHVLYHNRTPYTRTTDPVVGQIEYCAQLHGLLQRSDFVVLLVPYSPATRHIIGAPELAAMKRGATLINIGRGGLVHTDALVHALRDESRQLFAALDVTDPEPLPAGHELLTVARDRTVIVPHFGSATYRTRRAMVELAIRNLTRGLAGRAPEYNAYDTKATTNAEIV